MWSRGPGDKSSEVTNFHVAKPWEAFVALACMVPAFLSSGQNPHLIRGTAAPLLLPHMVCLGSLTLSLRLRNPMTLA